MQNSDCELKGPKEMVLEKNKNRALIEGPVRSQKEETRVLRCAKAIAGEAHVINEMEIVPSKIN